MGDLFAPMHLIVVLAIAMVVFGPGKLPELGSGLGKAIGNFKKGLNEGEQQALEGKKLLEAPAEHQGEKGPSARA
jgi:TatA/E family protein of Tat protein translocase